MRRSWLDRILLLSLFNRWWNTNVRFLIICWIIWLIIWLNVKMGFEPRLACLKTFTYSMPTQYCSNHILILWRVVSYLWNYYNSSEFLKKHFLSIKVPEWCFLMVFWEFWGALIRCYVLQAPLIRAGLCFSICTFLHSASCWCAIMEYLKSWNLKRDCQMW